MWTNALRTKFVSLAALFLLQFMVTETCLSDPLILKDENQRRRCEAGAWGTCRYGVTDTSWDYRSPAGYKICKFIKKNSTNPQLMNGPVFSRDLKSAHLSTEFYGPPISGSLVLDYWFDVINISDAATSEDVRNNCDISYENQLLKAECICNIGYTDEILNGGSCGHLECQALCFRQYGGQYRTASCRGGTKQCADGCARVP